MTDQQEAALETLLAARAKQKADALLAAQADAAAVEKKRLRDAAQQSFFAADAESNAAGARAFAAKTLVEIDDTVAVHNAAAQFAAAMGNPGPILT